MDLGSSLDKILLHDKLRRVRLAACLHKALIDLRFVMSLSRASKNNFRVKAVNNARDDKVWRAERRFRRMTLLFAIVYQIGWIINLIYNSRNIHELT